MRNQYAPLLPANVIAKAEQSNVPLLLDGLKTAKVEVPGGECMVMETMSVERGVRVVGTAMMVGADNGDNLPIHVANYSVKEDGYVMVIDGRGYADQAYFGDSIMGAYQAIGLKGMVINSYTRDRDGNVELGFPVYSQESMPRGPIKKDEGNINTPIMHDGVKAKPGDLVVGGSDGVCMISRECTETALSKVEKKLAYEENREKMTVAYQKAKAEGRELPQLAPQQVLGILQAK